MIDWRVNVDKDGTGWLPGWRVQNLGSVKASSSYRAQVRMPPRYFELTAMLMPKTSVGAFSRLRAIQDFHFGVPTTRRILGGRSPYAVERLVTLDACQT